MTRNLFDREYNTLVHRVLQEGDFRKDRTGTGAYSVFGHQMRFNLQDGFPLLTTKKLHTRSIFIELLWFLRGETNNKWLQERGVTIWDEWADPETGELGPVYGKQWRDWDATKVVFHKQVRYDGDDGIQVIEDTVDQVANLIEGIKTNPYGRRHIVSAWNPAEVDDMALPPCHMMFQMFVSSKGELSCQLYQRSVDIGLGLPFNIASYALLTHMVAQVCRLKVGEFIHTSGDAHIYVNHVEQLKEQIQRTPRDPPQLKLNENITSINGFTYEDIDLWGYNPHPHIKMDVAK